MLNPRPAASAVRSWKKFFGGLATALLLVPLPAFAGLTWNGFNTSSTPSSGGVSAPTWTLTEAPNGNTDVLTIYAAGISNIRQGTFTTTVGVGSAGETITPSISGLNAINALNKDTNLSYQVQTNTNPISYGYTQPPSAAGNNMFTSVTLPTAGPYNGSAMGTNVGTSATTVTVTISFVGNNSGNDSGWGVSTSSSAFTLTLNGT